MIKKPLTKERLLGFLSGEKSIATRFRNTNIAFFALAFFLMTLTMLLTFNGIIKQTSSGYAKRYALSSANALGSHIVKEIGLIDGAAHSGTVINWLEDEYNPDKRLLAYQEMSAIIGGLYSNNLYVGVDKSLNEYNIERNHDAAAIQPFDVLRKDTPEDAWYFECIASDSGYSLSVDIDHVLQRKRVWLDYKVARDGVPLGVIATGLEFSHVAGELFSQYNGADMRGLIIDGDGVIYIDSYLLDNENYLTQGFGTEIESEFSDPGLLAAINTYLNSVDSSAGTPVEPAVIDVAQGPYHYAAIAPIRSTNWSAVILYNSSSSLGMSLFFPAFAALLFLLFAFALAVSVAGYRLIFNPLEHLVYSLARLRENQRTPIYGLERQDEFGSLSKAIHDLFTKANYDALTGIHNRRFMEDNLPYTMEFLSRSKGLLSVIMVDIDYFKKYNDAYGHDQGDVCLKMVAQALAGSITRTTDFAARYGGEEFIAVLPNTDEAGALQLADELLKNVRALNIPHKNSDVAGYVTVSVGVATGRVEYVHNWEAYLKRADEALYMSKQSGRNRCTYLGLTEAAPSGGAAEEAPPA